MTINPELHYRLAVERIAEIRRQAERARAACSRAPRRQLRVIEAVRARRAFLLVQIGLHLLARKATAGAEGRDHLSGEERERAAQQVLGQVAEE